MNLIYNFSEVRALARETEEVVAKMYIKYLSSTDENITSEIKQVLDKYGGVYDKVMQKKEHLSAKVQLALFKIKLKNPSIYKYKISAPWVSDINENAMNAAIKKYDFNNIEQYLPLNEENIDKMWKKLEPFFAKTTIQNVGSLYKILKNKIATLKIEISDEANYHLQNVFAQYIYKMANYDYHTRYTQVARGMSHTYKDICLNFLGEEPLILNEQKNMKK